MSNQILVPMKRGERMEEIIPYLKQIVREGMKVVFLIPYPVKLWVYLRDHWVATESVREAVLSGGKIMDQYSWDLQQELAEQQISLARRLLQNPEVELAVDVYAHSLRRVIEDYTATGDVYLIMMRARSGLRILKSLCDTMALFGFFRQSTLPPVLLLRPDQGN
jgi:hypothetical protein